MAARTATHAGSWYSGDGKKLSGELDGWLGEVTEPDLPAPGARVIIAPHAGYSYSGPTAAWAYQALDVSKAKRVFLLGPSHHVYLSTAALSKFARYATPLGDLAVDRATTEALHATGEFSWMSASADEDEHSLELHLPYIHKALSRAAGSAAIPPLVPVMVGSTSAAAEKKYGALLAPYLADPDNAFVVSSDFAHWGLRFHYTYYLPSPGAGVHEGSKLRSGDRGPFRDPTIYESIEKVDRACMDAIEGGSHDEFLAVLKRTGNTVCGQHPIGVLMAAMEALDDKPKAGFKFVRYARSSDCTDVKDSSVSYASAYAVI